MGQTIWHWIVKCISHFKCLGSGIGYDRNKGSICCIDNGYPYPTIWKWNMDNQYKAQMSNKVLRNEVPQLEVWVHKTWTYTRCKGWGTSNKNL